jgi:hypothetical protein
VLKYFRTEEEPKAKLPSNFIGGFLAVCILMLESSPAIGTRMLIKVIGTELSTIKATRERMYIFQSMIWTTA